MTDNERFNAALNSCQNPRAVYSVLQPMTPSTAAAYIAGLTLEQKRQLNELLKALERERCKEVRA